MTFPSAPAFLKDPSNRNRCVICVPRLVNVLSENGRWHKGGMQEFQKDRVLLGN